LGGRWIGCCSEAPERQRIPTWSGPQLREVAGERLELLARGLGPWLVVLGEFGFGLGELAQLLLPARLEAAGDEAVVRFAGVERALGADRLVPGALDAQRDRTGRARTAVGDLVGGGERQLDLPRCECREQLAGDQFVDDTRLDRPATGCRVMVGTRVGALVVAALTLIARRHRAPTGAAAHDPWHNAAPSRGGR
jgi:hypothetical protein